ncbi:MAG: hypothetical protein KatS3mg124_0848 [Porticoccaceae bacterium]|nr:MAG: hypothetical protein KatS3mg124_0848 [Porticoccaceae bacterium]
MGHVALADLHRLAAAVLEASDSSVELLFRRDDQQRTLVEGRFSLEVTLVCQRCLEPVRLALSGECRVGVVGDEARAAQLPRRLDAWVVEGEAGDLYEWLEDEFLLALPIVPFHDRAECAASGRYSTGGGRPGNPFAALRALKGGKD